MELIADGGLEALSMTRLATAADYTPGALYRYVDSKDALLSKLVARILEDLGAVLRRSVSRLPDQSSPLARVFALLQGILLLHKSTRHAPQILDIARLATRGTRSLLLGWGANPRTVDAAIARVAKLGEVSQPIEGAA